MTENILHFSTDLGIGREPKPVALLIFTPDGKLTVGEGVTADEWTRFMLQQLNAQVEALVLAERESCAELVESFDACDPKHIAKAIRARGNQ